MTKQTRMLRQSVRIAASAAMLTALKLAAPVCEDAYHDAKNMQADPVGDFIDCPEENAMSTEAAYAAWSAVLSAIALAEGVAFAEPER